MTTERDSPGPRPLLAGNSRTSLPLYYWSIICGLTVGLSLLPMLSFMDEVRNTQGPNALTALVLVSFGTLFIASKLPSGCFRIRRFERDGRLYEVLGVRMFRRVVPMGDGINRLVRRFQPDYRIVSQRSIADFEKRTVDAEGFHVTCLLAILPSALYSVFFRWWVFALLLTLPNIVLHVYPVLLQRYTRARIQRVRQQYRSKQ